MTPHLKEREMHHPNASKVLSQYPALYIESAFGNMFISQSF